MIVDDTLREAFTRAYQKHLAHPERALPEGTESPVELVYRHPGLAAARERDRRAQIRQDKGLDPERRPKPVFVYRDKPAGAQSLAAALLHYVDFLGAPERFPLAEMAAMQLPLCVWQSVFTAARKHAERRGRLSNPPNYVMEVARRQARSVQVLPLA